MAQEPLQQQRTRAAFSETLHLVEEEGDRLARGRQGSEEAAGRLCQGGLVPARRQVNRRGQARRGQRLAEGGQQVLHLRIQRVQREPGLAPLALAPELGQGLRLAVARSRSHQKHRTPCLPGQQMGKATAQDLWGRRRRHYAPAEGQGGVRSCVGQGLVGLVLQVSVHLPESNKLNLPKTSYTSFV